MSAQSRLTDRLHLHEVPGSVGEYLATPAGISPVMQLSRLCFGTAMLLALAAVVVVVFRGELQVGVVDVSIIDLSPLLFVFIPLTVLAISGGIALAIYARVHDGANVDHRSMARKALLAVMLQLPRFGIGRQTMLADVQLRVRYLPGYRREALQAWSPRYRFSDDDFTGVTAGDFGAIALRADRGRLYVFTTARALEKWGERQ